MTLADFVESAVAGAIPIMAPHVVRHCHHVTIHVIAWSRVLHGAWKAAEQEVKHADKDIEALTDELLKKAA